MAVMLRDGKDASEINENGADELLEAYFATSKETNSIKVGVKTVVFSLYAKNKRALDLETALNIELEEPKKRCPSTEDIHTLENAMLTARDKALLWFLASAPVRIGTLKKLLWKDLQPTSDPEVPYLIEIESARLKGRGKGKFKGAKQICFLHSLAVEKLEAYKNESVRKGYKLTDESPIFIAYRKNKKIFQYTAITAQGMFGEASLTSWGNLDEKRYSPYDFRDYVQNALENAGVAKNIISPILAHKIKGVDSHFSDHNIKDFLEKFKTALPYLLPETVAKVKSESDKKLAEQNNRIRYLEQKLLDHGLTVDKKIANILEEIRNQSFEILQLQDKTKIKPKPVKKLY